MRTLTAALLMLLSTPALAVAPWLGGEDVSDDAIADAPDPDPGGDDRVSVDLRNITGTLEEGVRRVVVDGADPLEALPIELTPAPETTAAELRGLLAGSGARAAKLHGVEIRWILWKETTAVHAFRATVLPGQATALLALAPTALPDAPAKGVLPGGLGRNWRSVEKQLAQTLRAKRCGDLPVVQDSALQTVVPAKYMEQAKTARNRGAAQRDALCAAATDSDWDRLELRLDTLHFNLFDDAGALRGGLRLGVDPTTGIFAYPLFKKLQ